MGLSVVLEGAARVDSQRPAAAADQALRAVLAGNLGRAYLLARRVLGDPERAEDAVQEAALRCIRRPPESNEPRAAAAFFLSAVHGAAVDLLRGEVARRAREENSAMRDHDAPVSPAERLAEGEAARAAQREMEHLPPDQRVAVCLCCEQGFTQREAAEILGVPLSTLSERVGKGLDRLRQRMAAQGFAAMTGAGTVAALSTAGVPTAPAGLAVKLEALMIGKAVTTGAVASSSAAALKGGLLVKIGLGVAAAGLVAGGAFWAVGGKSEEPKPTAAAAKAAPYDPTVQPDFKGPEVVSGPDEPAIPGGGFKMERYAFAQIKGGIAEGSRLSCVAHNYCECVWWMDDNLVLFGDNILNVVLALDGDRLYRFAGSGVRGDKDGPAEIAEFSFGVYVGPHPSLVRTADGNFLISDPMNMKIKKIFKKPDGRWWVQTVAGGGGKALKLGDSANGPEVQFQKGTGPHAIWLCGPNRDHLYMITGQQSWRATYVMSPDGKVKCVGAGEGKDLPLGFPPEKGYTYSWPGGNWASWCMKTSRADGTAVKVVGYTDAELKEKEKTGWKKVWDGPVDDCCIHTCGGPLRPDGRAMYLIGGDQLFLRRVMNGRIMSLETRTGKWLESRDKELNPNSIGCVGISRLTWDGYAYLTYAYGGMGMYRAKIYEPLKRPEGK